MAKRGGFRRRSYNLCRTVLGSTDDKNLSRETHPALCRVPPAGPLRDLPFHPCQPVEAHVDRRTQITERRGQKELLAVGGGGVGWEREVCRTR